MTAPTPDEAAACGCFTDTELNLTENAHTVQRVIDQTPEAHYAWNRVLVALDHRAHELAALRVELEQAAWERDQALGRVVAAEEVATRMAMSLPDSGPWQSWSERDLAVRDYEGDLATALATETDHVAELRAELEQARTREEKATRIRLGLWDRLDRARAELAAVRPVLDAVRALPDMWDRQRAEYPINDDPRARAARAAVGLCAEELRAAVGGSAEAPGEPEQKPARYLASVCETCRHAYNHHASTGRCEYVIRRAPENARYQGVPEVEVCECSAFVDQPAESSGVGQPAGDTTQPADDELLRIACLARNEGGRDIHAVARWGGELRPVVAAVRRALADARWPEPAPASDVEELRDRLQTMQGVASEMGGIVQGVVDALGLRRDAERDVVLAELGRRIRPVEADAQAVSTVTLDELCMTPEQIIDGVHDEASARDRLGRLAAANTRIPSWQFVPVPVAWVRALAEAGAPAQDVSTSPVLADLATGYAARSERVRKMADGLDDRDGVNERASALFEGEANAYEDVARNLAALAGAAATEEPTDA